MSYLQESAINAAVRKLHYLGHQRRQISGQGEMGESFGAGLGSAISNGQMRNKRNAQAMVDNENMRQKQLASDKAQEDSDVEFIRGNSAGSPVKSDRYAVMQGDALPMPYDVSIDAKHAAQNMNNNDAAEHLSLGGQWTPNGLETMSDEAARNGRDRVRMKSLIQQQMYQPNPDGMGLGGTDAPYAGNF